MRARQEVVGLSSAQRRIESLRADLSWTLDSVDALTRGGEHEAAADLVEAQRDELARAVEGLARDVAARTRRATGHRALLYVAAVAAAAFLGAIVGIQVLRNTAGRMSLSAETRRDASAAVWAQGPDDRGGPATLASSARGRSSELERSGSSKRLLGLPGFHGKGKSQGSVIPDPPAGSVPVDGPGVPGAARSPDVPGRR